MAKMIRQTFLLPVPLLSGWLLWGCASASDSDEAAGVTSSALCSGTRLISTPSGPVTGNVTLTASPPTCAPGETPEYLFIYRRDGSSAWGPIQSWSPLATAVWNTTGLPSGSYHVYVYARSTGSSKSQSNDSAVVLVGDVCDSVTLAANATSPQPVGTALLLSAEAVCTAGVPEYQFRAKPTAGPAVVLQDWSANASMTWNTSLVPAGSYRVTVLSRASGNVGFEAQDSLSFRFGETCREPTLSFMPASPGAPGATVQLTAAASCTSSVSPEYRFSFRPSASQTWIVLQDWSGAATAAWPTTGLALDDYRVRLETRASDYAGPHQAYQVSTYVVGPWCSAASLNVTPDSPPALDAVLSLSASAACGGASAEYRFWSREPDAAEYTELRGWGPATASFDTAGVLGGAYAFKVQARAAGNVSSYQAERVIGYKLGHVCSNVTLAASPPSPSFPGTSVDLLATSTCANAGVPEYQFAARAAGSASWTLLRDWGPGSASWDTAGSPWNAHGEYQLRVGVRGQGQAGPAESTRTIGYSLQAGCLADSVYDIQINGSYTDKMPIFPYPQVGNCTIRSHSYQGTLRATVTSSAVEVVGSRFAGTYAIVDNTAAGFTAQADEGESGFTCDELASEYADQSGTARLTFDCATSTVTFDASCISDNSADGCYPNYADSATGSGVRVP